MLVLTRKMDESITIGNDIIVSVLEIKGNKVKLGIDAPKQTPIHRTEIYTAIIEENIKAADAPQDIRNVDEITSPTMHHSFRPPLSDLKSQKY